MSHPLDPPADLFKALSSASRLSILRVLNSGPSTVGHIASEVELSQPLVSQHLRVLRESRLVSVERTGREAQYSIADQHIAHIVEDAIRHTSE